MKLHEVGVVVLGLSHTALGTIRSLARQGVNVTAVTGPGNGGVAAHTTRARKLVVENYLDEGFIDVLLEISLETGDRPVLVPTGDYAVLCVSRHRDELNDYFRFVLPDETTVEVLMDKIPFAQWAMANDVLVPKTVCLERGNESPLPDDLRFPCVLKPAVKDENWTDHSVPKAMQVDDIEMLKRACEDYWAYADRLVLQEVIPGTDRQVKFCLVYISASGEVLATYEGEKIRQYPPRYGSTSLAVGTPRGVVTETAVDILQKADFRGIGSVEFKQDPRDGRLYVTEPTVGRPDQQSGLAAGAGVDIAYIAYCDAAGIEIPPQTVGRPGHKWLFERDDVASALHYIRSGELKVSQWMRSLSGPRTCATFAWDDPLPFMCLSLGFSARVLGIRTKWW